MPAILSFKEKELLERLQQQQKHLVYRITRNGPRTGDLVIYGKMKGVEFDAWFPLLAINYLVNWKTLAIAQKTDFPEEVIAGDWSGIRNSHRDKIWNIFETELL